MTSLAFRFLTVLLFLASNLTAFAAPRRKTYPMNVPAPGATSIVFDLEEGDFVLRGDPAATEVRMQVSIDRAWIFKLGEEGILKRLIKISGEGTPELTIRTDIPRAISNWGRAQYPIDFEVVVPAGARLTLRDSSGVIEVSGMQGPVEIDDGSGTLSVRQLAGPLRVRKESGDVRIEDVAGATTIHSRSGQMKLRRLGDLTIEASEGNVDLSAAASARIQNAGGNLNLTDIRGDLVIDDDSGEIVITDAPGRVVVRDDSGQIRITRAGQVEISDTSGDVTVHSAAGLRVHSKESGEVKVRDIGSTVEVAAGVKLKQE
ncbi:MAG: DUF4097 family beta strand repeat-containing protein [Terriglobales bacterium]